VWPPRVGHAFIRHGISCTILGRMDACDDALASEPSCDCDEVGWSVMTIGGWGESTSR
jgi:hypothetical protein